MKKIFSQGGRNKSSHVGDSKFLDGGRGLDGGGTAPSWGPGPPLPIFASPEFVLIHSEFFFEVLSKALFEAILNQSCYSLEELLKSDMEYFINLPRALISGQNPSTKIA